MSFRPGRALLATYLRPEWPRALLLGVSLFAGIGLQLANPQVTRLFIDRAQSGEPLERLVWIAVLFLGLALLTQAATIGETYVDMLARHGLPEITADGERDPQADGASPPPSGSFAAWFAEVRVDADLGLLRVARIVSAVDAGRILDEKLARSQIIDGAVMGIGMTTALRTAYRSSWPPTASASPRRRNAPATLRARRPPSTTASAAWAAAFRCAPLAS